MTEQTTKTCMGSKTAEDHTLLDLGACPHEVGGATYTYREWGCPECGATFRRTEIFACGTRRKAIRPTPDNCIALKWKADRAQPEAT